MVHQITWWKAADGSLHDSEISARQQESLKVIAAHISRLHWKFGETKLHAQDEHVLAVVKELVKDLVDHTRLRNDGTLQEAPTD